MKSLGFKPQIEKLVGKKVTNKQIGIGLGVVGVLLYFIFSKKKPAVANTKTNEPNKTIPKSTTYGQAAGQQGGAGASDKQTIALTNIVAEPQGEGQYRITGNAGKGYLKLDFANWTGGGGSITASSRSNGDFDVIVNARAGDTLRILYGSEVYDMVL